MSSCIGKERHGFRSGHFAALGVIVDGPARIHIDKERLQAFLSQRAPGRTPGRRRAGSGRARNSSASDGMTCGAPVAALIRNTSVNLHVTMSFVLCRDRDVPIYVAM